MPTEDKIKPKPLPPANPPKITDPEERRRAIRRATSRVKLDRPYDVVRLIREVRGKL